MTTVGAGVRGRLAGMVHVLVDGGVYAALRTPAGQP
jgi:hypothetical protein